MSNLSVRPQPLFAEEFYKLIPILDGRTPAITPNGTISTLSTATDKLNKDAHLQTVNDRLVEVVKQLKNKQSSEYIAFKQELGRAGIKGITILQSNFYFLESVIKTPQPQNCFIRLIQRVINFFAKLFGCKVAYPDSSIKVFDRKALDAKLEEIVKEIFHERKGESTYLLEVLGTFKPKELTTENIQANELDLKYGISFQVGTARYHLHFDKEKNHFVLQLTRSEKDVCPFTLSDQKSPAKVQTFKATVLDKEEQKPLTVLYKSFYEPTRNGGFSTYSRYSDLSLRPNREYEILNEKGPSLRFKLVQKTQEASKRIA